MFNRLMVAFDGSEPSRRALLAGLDLAQRLEVPLHTITVLEDSPVYLAAAGTSPIVLSEIRAAGDAYADVLRREAAQLGLDRDVEVHFESVYGNEVEEIVQAVVRKHIDLLVVGLRTHPGLIDRLTSHTNHDLSERAPCSLLGIK